MSEDQFAKLFQYMERRFGEAEHAQAELKADINRMYNLLDVDLKRRQTDEHERLAMNDRLDRHEGWIDQLAKGTNISLTSSGS